MSGTFSILERIDVGETLTHCRQECSGVGLSVSSNGSTWVKRSVWSDHGIFAGSLSVSSNGSTWVKQGIFIVFCSSNYLSVSSNGSTWVKRRVKRCW